jgi:tetratricopeptide (TPR) repeat protein
MKIFKIYILVIFLSVFLATPGVCQIPDSFQYYLDQAKVSIYKNDYRNAYFFLESAHLLSPGSDEPIEYLKQIQFSGAKPQAFEQFMNQGNVALNSKDYRSALFYFTAAHQVDPARDEALSYINLTKRSAEGLREDQAVVKSEESSAAHARLKQTAKPVEILMKVNVGSSVSDAEYSARDSSEGTVPRIDKKVVLADVSKQLKIRPKQTVGFSEEILLEDGARAALLRLDDFRLEGNAQPQIKIEINKSVVIASESITRFLAVTDNMLDIERLNSSQIIITARVRGASFLHVWEGEKRYTFNVVGVLPEIESEQKAHKAGRILEEYEEPFKFAYSNNWNSLYLGPSMQELELQSLFFTQWMGVYGKTPYGKFDASVNFYKFEESTELVGQALGLTDGKVGPFKDFTIRGYDTSTQFSPLSLPQRSFRGGLLDAYAFNRNIKYIVFQGNDRSVFLTLSPGVTELRQSFMEGVRIVLFPDQRSQVGFNYARGYGEERQNDLRDKVFSIDAKHRYGHWSLFAETGYDEENTAQIINNRWDGDEYLFELNFRDIDKDYTTITSRPVGQGEVGGEFNWNWSPGENDVSANIDIYRNREIPNEDDPNGVNLDAGFSYNQPLAEKLYWNTNIFYNNTAQLISPQESFRVNNTLTKNFDIFHEKTLALFITHAYHINRFSNVPSAEYDRNGITTGFRVSLIRNLSFFTNYEYSIVKEIDNGGVNTPSAINMGVNYSRNFVNNISGRVGLSYRNEEDADDRFSFLSGQDSMIGNIGVSYRPHQEMEIFLDTRVRNIWKENLDQIAFNEADIRLGMRSSWDLFFSWNPAASIRGVVYKDLNSNFMRDKNEPGIANIIVKVGKKSAVTNQYGEYKAKIAAKAAVVELDVESVPAGYVFTSDLLREVKIENGEVYHVDFGLTTKSGIYGVVYFDKNGNMHLDEADELISKAKIILDKTKTVYSDQNGAYFFEEITPGKHSLSFDVNSLSLEYIPLIKLKQEIDVIEGTTYTLHLPLRKK